jgi:TonB family protein
LLATQKTIAFSAAFALGIVTLTPESHAEGASSSPSFDRSSCGLPEPRYPVESRRNNETGKVILKVFIEATGVASMVEIDKTSGHDLLDAAGRSWMLNCRFKPKIVDGKAESSWVLVPLNFDAPVTPPRDPSAACESPAPDYPIASRRSNESGTVALRYHVLEDGWADRVEIESSSGFSRLDAAARDWLIGCNFLVASENGVTTARWGTQVYTFHLQR